MTVTLGVVVMALCGYLVYALGSTVGWLFSPDDAVQYRVALLAPIVAGFQLAYGLQGCAQGPLRAVGKQAELAALAFVCLWVVGLPLGWYLCYFTDPPFGPEGFWIGSTIGVGLLAVSTLLVLSGIDWDKEMRRSILCAVRTRTGDFVPLSVAVPSTRGMGTRAPFFVSNRLLEELEDVDSIRLEVYEHE